MGILDVLINNYLDGRHACYFAYVSQSNTLYLIDDAGNSGGPFAGGMVLNGAGSLTNGQCTIAGAGSSAVGNGALLTLTLNITFKAAFTGNKIMYLDARDTGSGNSGWQTLGTWSVPGAATNGPAVGGGSPPHSTSS